MIYWHLFLAKLKGFSLIVYGVMLHWFYWQLSWLGSVSNKFILVIHCVACSLHTTFLCVSVLLWIAILS